MRRGTRAAPPRPLDGFPGDQSHQPRQGSLSKTEPSWRTGRLRSPSIASPIVTTDGFARAGCVGQASIRKSSPTSPQGVRMSGQDDPAAAVTALYRVRADNDVDIARAVLHSAGLGLRVRPRRLAGAPQPFDLNEVFAQVAGWYALARPRPKTGRLGGVAHRPAAQPVARRSTRPAGGLVRRRAGRVRRRRAWRRAGRGNRGRRHQSMPARPTKQPPWAPRRRRADAATARCRLRRG